MAIVEQKPEVGLDLFLRGQEKAIRDLAPKYVNTKRLLALILAASMRDAKIAKSTKESIILFGKKCAEYGTDRVGAGGMWPVAYWNKEKKAYELVAIPDWRLMVEKTKQAKAITHASADIVWSHDDFAYERGMEPKLSHVPKLGDRGEPVAAYCVFTLPGGEKDFVVMTWQEVLDIRNRSKAKDSGPWVTDLLEMAKKTVIKRALKIFEGASPELTRLMQEDNSVSGFIDIDMAAPIADPVELPPPPPPPSVKKKVVAEEPKEAAPVEPEPSENTPPPDEQTAERPADKKTVACVKCKTNVYEGSPAHVYSMKHFGKPMCFKCGHNQETGSEA